MQLRSTATSSNVLARGLLVGAVALCFGFADMTPVKAQIEMLNRIKPIKTLGHVYASSEVNANVPKPAPAWRIKVRRHSSGTVMRGVTGLLFKS